MSIVVSAYYRYSLLTYNLIAQISKVLKEKMLAETEGSRLSLHDVLNIWYPKLAEYYKSWRMRGSKDLIADADLTIAMRESKRLGVLPLDPTDPADKYESFCVFECVYICICMYLCVYVFKCSYLWVIENFSVSHYVLRHFCTSSLYQFRNC